MSRINFYLKCHKCGGIQFTLLAITDELKRKFYNVVCIHCGHESTLGENHTASEAK